VDEKKEEKIEKMERILTQRLLNEAKEIEKKSKEREEKIDKILEKLDIRKTNLVTLAKE
jgi:hypothetical protein